MLREIARRLIKYPLVRWLHEKATYLSAQLCYYPFLIKLKLKYRDHDKLHIGCGRNRFKGWVNADITPVADAIIFIERRLPFRSSSLKLIYSEHVLEHVSYDVAHKFVTEAKRVLGDDGVLRIAMPDLDTLVDQYQSDWKSADWVNWPEFSFIETRAQMINIAFRWWGHRHLYNREELARLLKSAGFQKFKFYSHGESDCLALKNLETRADSLLIVEAYQG